MKAGHDGQLLHGQLLGGLLVAMATAAFDLSTAAKVLWPGEPRQERMRFRAHEIVSVCVCACSAPVNLGRTGTILLFMCVCL